MKVNFTETVLRDANQSLIATRMPYEDFEAILPELDKAGYYSLECWGGATFDSCLRYLNEDPWERLRKIRKACPNTKLQMLLRGQNLLGYKHYPDDVVRLFVRKSVENGIDIIRIFDALNDLRNIETAVDETIKCGAHASGTICYTTSPIHNIESYIKLAKDLESMGVQSVCIKDMAGIMDPQTAYDLVKGIKENISLPVIVHTHSTTGLGPVTLQKAVEAGADVIDTAISCFSNGTSQPPTETMAYILQKEGYEVPLDMAQLKKINDFFKPVRNDALKSGLLNPVVLTTQTDALNYQIPGGMLSNLVAQLTAQNKRYKQISKEVKNYIKGEYGKAPGKINEELQKKGLGDEKPITCRYADLLEPGLPAAREYLGDRATCDEDVLSYIAFPTQAEAFFDKRDERKKNTFTYKIERLD